MQLTEEQQLRGRLASLEARAALTLLADPVAWSREMPGQTSENRWHAVPLALRGLWRRCVRGEATKTEAIKAMCLECCGYDREAVKTCPAEACPLWRQR